MTVWRWYCRWCGASGSTSSEYERDCAAYGHLATEHGTVDSYNATAGYLLHVWPRS